jgi:hypothetical protein
VFVVGVCVEAAVRTQLVELGIEQIRITDALAVLTQRVDAALRVAITTGVLVVLDVDATVAAAIQSSRWALTSGIDAAT